MPIPTTLMAPPHGVALPRSPIPQPHKGAPPLRTDGKDQIWPHLPSKIKDSKSNREFTIGKHLGDGGFARCFEAHELATGKVYAVKVMEKRKLHNHKRNQEKLLSEIRIHRSLHHSHIVSLDHCFEDTYFVYLIMELCENQSLMDLIKRRKRLSEPEVRYFMLQVITAVQFMHESNIIHRDLKLGNIFINRDLSLKIGDFGLAAKLIDEDDRKKSFCGTPNYIAPELLYDKHNGYSYQVDVWALGIIMYSLLFGAPPFQIKGGKDTGMIYQRIKTLDYTFPAHINVSPAAKALIKALLSKSPESRPHIKDIRNFEFFRFGYCPKYLPHSALTTEPTFTVSPIHMEDKEEIKPMKEVKQKHVQIAPGFHPHNLQPPRIKADLNFQQHIRTKPSGISLRDKGNLDEPIHKIEVPKDLPTVPTVTKPHNRIQPIKLAPPHIPPGGNPPAMAAKSPTKNSGRRSETLQLMQKNLAWFFNSCKGVPGFDPLPQVLPPDSIQPPDVFLIKWIDLSSKYGLGYQLTNGSFGIYFNDCTTLILASDEIHVEYLSYHTGSHRTKIHRDKFSISTCPMELHKKMKLLFDFRNYMKQNLHSNLTNSAALKDQPVLEAMMKNLQLSQTLNQNQEQKPPSHLHFLTKFLRTKHATFFRMSNGLVQVNFRDHSKILLSKEAQVVTFITAQAQIIVRCLWNTEEILKDREFATRLSYVKDVIDQIIERKIKTTS